VNRINIKPLSVNDAWQGRRFKTKEYKKYEIDCNLLLPGSLEIPDGYLKIYFEWGLSNFGGDYDNPIKPIQDIISKKYGFNDNRIVEGTERKVKVKKGQEYIKFKIEKWEG